VLVCQKAYSVIGILEPTILLSLVRRTTVKRSRGFKSLPRSIDLHPNFLQLWVLQSRGQIGVGGYRQCSATRTGSKCQYQSSGEIPEKGQGVGTGTQPQDSRQNKQRKCGQPQQDSQHPEAQPHGGLQQITLKVCNNSSKIPLRFPSRKFMVSSADIHILSTALATN
jgi:hypothetical protein